MVGCEIKINDEKLMKMELIGKNSICQVMISEMENIYWVESNNCTENEN